MTRLFNDLKEGLEQAIEMERNRPAGLVALQSALRAAADDLDTYIEHERDQAQALREVQKALRRAVEAKEDELNALKEVQEALRAAVADLDD